MIVTQPPLHVARGVVRLVHGDIETTAEARLLTKVDAEATRLGCTLRRGTNDTSEWVLPSQMNGSQLVKYLKGLNTPGWWHW
jgi:hypothetical protein